MCILRNILILFLLLKFTVPEWLILAILLVLLQLKTFELIGFAIFLLWSWLFQKRAVCTKLDIYIFIYVFLYGILFYCSL